MSRRNRSASNKLFPHRYETLIRVAKEINAYRTPTQLFEALAKNLHQVVNFHVLAIGLYKEEEHVVLGYALEIDSGELPVSSIASNVENTVTWWVRSQQKPLIIPLLEEETRFKAFKAFYQEQGTQSACALPLTTVHRRLGTIVFGSRYPDAYSAHDVGFLSTVAEIVALALDDALNFEAARAANEALQHAYEQVKQLKDQLAQEKHYLEDEIRTERGFEEIIGESESLRAILRQIETVAPTDATVLIYGETGTGKELIARAIHNLSSRAKNTFVKINCAAIPSGLLETELFGHERGAFTGAISQRIGRFEIARGGTAFLDEISELPLELQPKLLRVLQEREFERLGSTQTLRTDARVISTTNRDLAAMVEHQQFRRDLYYRLNVFPIYIPPLRARREDIPLLVRHFVLQFSRTMKKSIDRIPAETINALVRYDWPGNVREVQNLIERAVILSNGATLQVPVGELRSIPFDHHDSLQDVERRHIVETLETTNWVVSGAKGAAARLGLKRSTLQSRMRKLRITRP